VRTRGFFTIVSFVAACKGNFQVVPDAATDAPPDAPPNLACQPTRLPAAGMVPALATADPRLINQLAVVPTPRGYHLFFLDAANSLHGASFEFANGELVEKSRTTAPIATAVTGAIGAIALEPSSNDNAEVLLAVPCSDTSTALIPLDAQLQAASNGTTTYDDVIHDGWNGGRGSLVRADGDRVLFLAVKNGTPELYAKRVSRLGIEQDGGAPRRVDTAGTAPSGSTITPAGTGYLVTWDAADLTPNEVQATMLDGQLDVVAPTTKISPDIAETMSDSDLPAAAYSAGLRMSLFAWVIKISNDQIWLSLRDEKLGQMSQTIATKPDGNLPAVAAGDSDFLVVWTDAGSGLQLGAARVGPDGSLSRPGLSTTGGTASGWDVVVRQGQPALIWFEEVSSGPYLWFDALCRPGSTQP
jgi:hypothetical protein